MRSLSWKLGIALLLIVVISIGLMAFLINWSTTRAFHQYIYYSNLAYAQRVEEVLSQFYASEYSWDKVQEPLSHSLRSRNDRLIIVDNLGTIVGDTYKAWLGKSAGEVELNDGIPITVSGKEVGTLYLTLNPTVWAGKGSVVGRLNARAPFLDAAMQAFLKRVNTSLWIAGIIAVAVAILIGLILTRQITEPIRALTAGAHNIARRRLDYRVKVKSKDEIGELADSFNAMASSLDKSEKSRRQLVADITHELRTPLTIIEGTVDGITDGVFPPDTEHLGSIKEQTAMLTRLTDDLREISLAESGQLKLELASTNMVELVQRKISQAEPLAREKNIQLELKAGQGVPQVNVDVRRMEQVIANLITNAIWHVPGGGSITISLMTAAGGSAHEIEKPSLIVSVADTGEGITPEHLPYIFERFYRAESSRSKSQGGVGLGLAIVKQMVQAHGGKVWAESEPGRGSTFFIALPLAG